jgi:hypothetical protein
MELALHRAYLVVDLEEHYAALLARGYPFG